MKIKISRNEVEKAYKAFKQYGDIKYYIVDVDIFAESEEDFDDGVRPLRY